MTRRKHKKSNYHVQARPMDSLVDIELGRMPPMVSLKTLSKQLDAHRSSVRRWLTTAGIEPMALGTKCKGAIRYRRSEIEAWLNGLERVE